MNQQLLFHLSIIQNYITDLHLSNQGDKYVNLCIQTLMQNFIKQIELLSKHILPTLLYFIIPFKCFPLSIPQIYGIIVISKPNRIFRWATLGKERKCLLIYLSLLKVFISPNILKLNKCSRTLSIRLICGIWTRPLGIDLHNFGSLPFVC